MNNKIQAPPAGVEAFAKPWEQIDWTHEQQRALFAQWTIYYNQKFRYAEALKCADEVLKLDPNNTIALTERSKILRSYGRCTEALISCLKAEEILKSADPPKHDFYVNLNVVKAFHESNRFEDSKIQIQNTKPFFSNQQLQSLKNLEHVIDETYKDVLSAKVFPRVCRLIENMTASISRQTKEDKPECDVVSIFEKEDIFLSPLELARRKRLLTIYNQAYLNKNWIDVQFLKDLRYNDIFLLKQSPSHSAQLSDLLESGTETIRRLTKMLHSRCPMYSLHFDTHSSSKHEKQKEDNLYNIQYQTRRNMFKILRTIRIFIGRGELQKLNKFVEEVMGDYVTIKTSRVMPWKFEFINEVYNYVGLARINEYKLPKDTKILTERHRLLTLLKLKASTTADIPHDFVFGDRSTIQSTEAEVDPHASGYKQYIARMEYRMRFAKYSIERCYILNEIAQSYLNLHNFAGCTLIAKKAVKEARQCRSSLWAVLSLMLMCKAHAFLEKGEQVEDVLKIAAGKALLLTNVDLCLFIDVCMKVNRDDLIRRATLNETFSKSTRSTTTTLN